MCDQESVFSGEDDLIDGTWKKVEKDVRKQGFREGALKGKEEAYQNGFDKGYAEGFKIGQALGFSKGSKSILRHFKCLGVEEERKLDDDLSNSQLKFPCILCPDDVNKEKHHDSASKNIESIIAEQRSVNDVVMKDLMHATHGNIS